MRKKKNTLFIILIIIASLGIGYAFLTTTLSIEGITDVDSNSWNVYWDNIEVIEGSVSGSQVIQAPTIDSSKTNLSYEIRLSKPGDFYEFTVDARNAGTIDAMIESVTTKLNGNPITTLPNYFNYSITYGDGISIEENQFLKAGKKERYRIKVEFKKDISASELPSEFQSLNIEFNISYIQADSNGVRVRNFLYLAPTTELTFGSTIPNSVQTFESYEELLNVSNHPMFIIHTLSNNQINASYVGFILNGDEYYVKGGGSTFDSQNNNYNMDSIYYEENKELLQSVFGEQNCEESISSDYIDFWCTQNASDGTLEVYISKDGYVEAVEDITDYDNSPYCGVLQDGNSICERL